MEGGAPMSYQVFSDMDGVLVNFEGGVLKYMNEKFQEIASNQEEYKALRGSGSPDYKLYKLARSAAKELGGWDVEINKWHIAHRALIHSLSMIPQIVWRDVLSDA